MANGDNMAYFVDECKFHIQDTNTVDADIEKLVLLSLNDIANDTKIFKKLYGFSIHDGLLYYDFNGIVNLGESLEKELSEVQILPLTPTQISDFFATAVLPDPEIDKTTFEDEARNTFIQLLNVYDEDGIDVSNKFKFRGTSEYQVTDTSWLEENDGKQLVAVCAVIPDIDELTLNIRQQILSAVVQGVKFYNSDNLEGQTDAQVANLYYKRYWHRRQELVNRYPTQVFAIANPDFKRRWL